MMKNYLIDNNSTIKQALKKLSECGEKCLLVVNKNNLLQGTLSDGDLRKSIVNNKSLSNKINNIYNKNPKKFYENKINKSLIEKYFIDLRLEIIPVVDKKNYLVDAILFSKYFSKLDYPDKVKFNEKIDVVIMAGGLGSRLAPFSKIIPKPLLPYKNSTIIEHIIDQFKVYNLNDFYISVHYKEALIKSYINSLDNKYKIKYIHENFPMGTIGSLSKLKKITKDFFLINCDTIININYLDFYNFHKTNKNDLTIVSCSKEFQIPYGCFEINNKGKMLKMVEKPKNNYLINTGLYLIKSKLLSIISKNTKVDFNTFLQKVSKTKGKIGFYTVDEHSWNDFRDLYSFNE